MHDNRLPVEGGYMPESFDASSKVSNPCGKSANAGNEQDKQCSEPPNFFIEVISIVLT